MNPRELFNSIRKRSGKERANKPEIDLDATTFFFWENILYHVDLTGQKNPNEIYDDEWVVLELPDGQFLKALKSQTCIPPYLMALQQATSEDIQKIDPSHHVIATISPINYQDTESVFMMATCATQPRPAITLVGLSGYRRKTNL